MNKPIFAALAAALLLLQSLPAAGQPSDEDLGDAERQEVYDAFRQEFEAGRFRSALPLAQRLVDLLEAQAPDSEQLPTAYNNLGAAQWRTGDLAGAEESFSRALELLEQTQGIASRRLIAPLAGLAVVYGEQGEHARAAETLQRAIAVSRRAEGLFNLEQLDLVEPLVRSLEALGLLDDVERELRFSLQIVQKRYGVDDPRSLPATVRLAKLYEETGRYPAARALWAHSAKIGSREGGGLNAATINGLLGIARTHRLQYLRDPESLVDTTLVDPVTGRQDLMAIVPSRPRVARLDPDGEAAALRAYEILGTAADPPRALEISVALELGDWYTTGREPDKAQPYYARAWQLLEASLEPGQTNALAVPRPVAYRAPSYSYLHLANPDVRTVAREMEFSLTVAETGEVTDVVPLSAQATENQVEAVQRALRKAWFSPRFEEGRAVRTEGFLFKEHWHEIAPPEPEPGEETDATSEEEP